MRILIGGEDEVAYRLVESLMADNAVTLICPKETVDANRISRMDAQYVAGSMTSASVLDQAHIKEADLFVACSSVDEHNIVACVSAERLGNVNSVCFLNRHDLQMPDEDAGSIAASLGIDHIVRPGLQLAEEILRIVEVPGALDVQELANGRVRLLRYGIEEDAPITRGTLKEIGLPPGVVLVMARRGEEALIPSGNTRFEPGDKVTAMGDRAGIRRLLNRYLLPEKGRRHNASATIVGAGTVGFAVARGLEDLGWDIKLIDSDRARCEEVALELAGLVLHGDGADADLLESENISERPVLVAVTSNDERNLLVSLVAKSIGVQRIVTRADAINNERLFETVGIDVVRSSRGAAIRSVLRLVDVSRAELVVEIDHGDAEVLELVMPDGLPQVALSAMRSELFGIIGAIERDGKVIIPRGQDYVQGGDHLLVFCLSEQEESVRAFFLEGLQALAKKEPPSPENA